MAGVDAYRALVRTAWGAALEDHDFDPAGVWGETGADSLKTLNLVFELERRSGRKVSFDWIEPTTTIDDLAAKLAHGASPEADSAAKIFLVPGVYGDEPILADFRRWFAGRLRFDLIDLPGPATPAAALSCMRRSGEAVADQVEARAPEGDLILAGYSLGGGAAYEAAAALRDRGRRVRLLIVLDTYLPETAPGAIPEPASARRLVDFAKDLIALEWDWGRRRLDKLAGVLAPQAAARVRRWLVRRFRLKALVSWRPQPLETAILLAVSAESEPVILPRWTALVPHHALIRLNGGHAELFTASAMKTLGPKVLGAVATATA